MPVPSRNTSFGRGIVPNNNSVWSNKQKQSGIPSKKIQMKKPSLYEAQEKIQQPTKSTSTSASSVDEAVYELDDCIQKKYTVINRLGRGAYGVVWEAEEARSKERVALKKIYDAFRDNTDAQRTYREIVFLQEFGNHPNIISLRKVHRAANDVDLYLVFPLLKSDLHKIIKTVPKALDSFRIRRIMYQTLSAIKYMHSAEVIHRDLKPANILLDESFHVKLGDFGLARSLLGVDGVDQTAEMTEYVATRWYRPPEILLKCCKRYYKFSNMYLAENNSAYNLIFFSGEARNRYARINYAKGVDMWAIGCILAEMIRKKALFPGSDSINQIEIVMGTIDEPPVEDIKDLTDKVGYAVVETAFQQRRRPLSSIFANESFDVLDLIENLLVFHPHKRYDVHQALAHPYFRILRHASEEMTSPKVVCPPLDDNIQLNMAAYRKSIYDIIKFQNIRKVEPQPRPIKAKPAPPLPEYKKPTLERKLSLTAAAVINSIKSKQKKAISLQNLMTTVETPKVKPTTSKPIPIRNTNSSQNTTVQQAKNKALTKSLVNLSINDTPDQHVKAHRSQAQTKVVQVQVQVPSTRRPPFPWEQKKAEVKKPVPSKTEKRPKNLETAPPPQEENSSNVGPKTPETLGTKGKSIKEASTERINELRRLLRTGTQEGGYTHIREVLPTRRVGLPGMDVRTRSRAVTSVHWNGNSFQIDEGPGQAFDVHEANRIVSGYGEGDVWSRPRTPIQNVGRPSNIAGNSVSHSVQKFAPYQKGSIPIKNFWDSELTPNRQIPGIELEDPNTRVRQSTYFPTRSPSAGGGGGGDYRYPNRAGYKPSAQQSPSVNNNRTHLPYIHNPGTNNNNHNMYRSPYESNIRRPDSRSRPRFNSTELNDSRNAYKFGR